MQKDSKANIHILVVDDEPGLRDMLSYELGLQGFKVQTASDGMEAVEKVKKQKFDLIVSDIKMPRMDGLAALEEIKKIDPNVEVIMATGFGTIDMAVSAMKKGAYDFVQKPYNIDEVSLLIEKALEKSDLRALIALYESSRVLFSTVKLNELLNIVMDLIQKVLSADEGSLMLLDGQNKLYIASSLGDKKCIPDAIYLGLGNRVAGWAAAQKREMLLINGLKDYPELSDIDTNSRIGSSIVIPLVFQEELLGVLNINRLTGHENFDTSDLRNASIFALQVAQAVQNAKMYQVLENKIEELKAAYQMLEETKDRLVESEKLASIGKLVSGVAHELNNPLTAVIGYAEILMQSELQGDAKEQVMIVYKEAERCRRIIQDLLVFARRREPAIESVDLEGLVRETVKTLSLELNKSSIQVLQKPTGPLYVFADSCQLKQVFMNILLNAVHALAASTGEKKIEISISKTERNPVKISFSDNGPGIEEKNISKIFDPFFTTKEVGKGTGLGLSLAYGIIQQHGGNISVQSKKGAGTVFTVELPIGEAQHVGAQTRTDRSKKASVEISGKHILIVEDEESIRGFLSRVLSGYGCKVETATDGADALAKLEKNDYDIVLSDFLMPKLNGAAVYEKVKVIKPPMAHRFIFMTGDADKKLIDFFGENHLLYLMKPFRPDDLIPLFREIIGKTHDKGVTKKSNKKETDHHE